MRGSFTMTTEQNAPEANGPLDVRRRSAHIEDVANEGTVRMATVAMNPAESPMQRLSRAFRETRYVVERTGLVVGTNLFMQAFHRLLGRGTETIARPSVEALKHIRERFAAMLSAD
ncbi:MAG: hypothetical protein ACI9MR_005027, partial [Myxococcota bacterium]